MVEAQSRRDRRATSFRKLDVVRAFEAARAAGMQHPIVKVDLRNKIITITPGTPSQSAQAIIRLRTQRGERRVMAPQSFSSYCDPDLPINVDGAAAALRAAGYTVHRLPDKYRKFLQFPLDDHIEAVFGDPNLDNLADINAIVEEFGGDCDECRPIATDYQPFIDFLSGMPGFLP
jgi:hypothetical protein